MLTPPQLPGATVLLTGALGFLGKVVLERLLASSKPARVFLLLRPKHGYSAQERLAHAKTRPCFAHLPPRGYRRRARGRHRVAGPRLGRRRRRRRRHDPRDHMAASVDFDLPLADAARADAVGALHVLEFARGCPRLKRLVHTSTAYVEWPDAADGLLGEPPPLDAALCDRLAKCDDDAPSLPADTALAPYPHTYATTQRAAEQLLVARRGTVALTICRPSIISASLRHPLPGWIDSKAALAGVAFMMGGGIMRTIAARPGSPLDIVPVDFALAAARRHRRRRALPTAAAADVVLGGGAAALLLPAVAGREQSSRSRSSSGYSFKRYPQGPYPRGRRLERPQPTRATTRGAPAIRAPRRAGYAGTCCSALLGARRPRGGGARQGIVAMRRIHHAFPHFSHTPYRFDAAPNAVHAWDANFDARAYATHGVMHGVYHYLLRAPCRRRSTRTLARRRETFLESSILCAVPRSRRSPNPSDPSLCGAGRRQFGGRFTSRRPESAELSGLETLNQAHPSRARNSPRKCPPTTAARPPRSTPSAASAR